MARDRLNLDFETYSDLDLSKTGVGVYARHSSTEALMAAFSLNGSPVGQCSFVEGEDWPREIAEALDDPDVEKWAWNAPFEIAILRHTMKRKVDLTQWFDTMVQASYCSFPGSLERAGPAMGFPEEMCKMTDGKRLMRVFSFPHKPTKANPTTRNFFYHNLPKWRLYLEYNRRDVEIEKEICDWLQPYRMPDWEWDLWRMDQDINERGLPINLAMVANALEVYGAAYDEGLVQMRELTGLSNPMSTQQLLPWLRERGYPFDDLKKGHVSRAVDFFEKPPESWGDNQTAAYTGNRELLEVLMLRRDLARTSIKKFNALEAATQPEDGVIRGTLQFYAAQRTGRWGGRLFQPQNLARPEPELANNIETHARNVELLDYESLKLLYPNVFDLLASTIRPAAQAPEGYVILDADLNAIENRVLGWIADCQKILDVFRNKMDPYIAFAVYLYEMGYEELWHEYKVLGNKGKRTISKPGVLGCGYMLGAGKEFENEQTGEMEATGLLGYAWNMDVKQFTLEDSEASVETFRREFSEVKDYWYGVERAMKHVIRSGEPQQYGHVWIDLKDDFCRIELPSKRHLHYYKPRVERKMMPWKKEKDVITYMNQNERKQWARVSTHPGKITENIDQAISRDLLAHGLNIAFDRGLDIRLHVHDQIVALSEEDKAERNLEILIDSMEEQPWWADGLPLGSEGFTCKMFQKD